MRPDSVLVPTIARTWAPRGKTPVLLTAGSWTKVSAISTITVSPKYRRLGLYCRFHPNKNIRAQQVVEFLTYFLRHVRGHVVLLSRPGITPSCRVCRWLSQRPSSTPCAPLASLCTRAQSRRTPLEADETISGQQSPQGYSSITSAARPTLAPPAAIPTASLVMHSSFRIALG